MEAFLEYVIKQLIEFPDEMVLTHHEAGRKTVFNLRLNQSDVRKVIGKSGHTIAALRALLNAAASRHGQKATLEIIEDRR